MDEIDEIVHKQRELIKAKLEERTGDKWEVTPKRDMADWFFICRCGGLAWETNYCNPLEIQRRSSEKIIGFFAESVALQYERLTAL